MAKAAVIRNEITRLQNTLVTYQAYSEKVELENIDLRSQLKKREEMIIDYQSQLEKRADNNENSFKAQLTLTEANNRQLREELKKYQEEKLSLEQRYQYLENTPNSKSPTSKDQTNLENRYLAMEKQNAEQKSQLETIQHMYSELDRQQTNKDLIIQQTNKELVDFKENNRVLMEQIGLLSAMNKKSSVLEQEQEHDFIETGTVQYKESDEEHQQVKRQLRELQDQSKHFLDQWQISQQTAEAQSQAYINSQMENNSLRTELNRLKGNESSERKYEHTINGSNRAQLEDTRLQIVKLQEQNDTLVEQLRLLSQASDQQHQAHMLTQRLNEALTEQLDRMKGGGGSAPVPDNEKTGELIKRLIKANEQNECLKEELKKAHKKWSDTVDGSNERGRHEIGFTHHMEQLAYLSAKLQRAQDDRALKSGRLRELQTELEGVRQENANLRRAWKDSEKMRSDLKEALNKTTEELRTLTKQSQTERSRAELTILRRQNELLSAEVTEVKTTLRRVQSNNRSSEQNSKSKSGSSSVEFELQADELPLTPEGRRSRRHNSSCAGRHKTYHTVLGWK